MGLPDNVANARKQRGITQEELAAMTNVTVRTIQRIEQGESTPRAHTLKTIAAALNTTFEQLSAIPISAGDKIINNRNESSTDAEEFLHYLHLSCFTYLVVPFVHFLVPVYLLKNKPGLPPKIIALAKQAIRKQVYWVIALNFTMFGTLLYNLLAVSYFNRLYTLSYLVPFFAMYLLNAILITAGIIKSKHIVQLTDPAS